MTLFFVVSQSLWSIITNSKQTEARWHPVVPKLKRWHPPPLSEQEGFSHPLYCAHLWLRINILFHNIACREIPSRSFQCNSHEGMTCKKRLLKCLWGSEDPGSVDPATTSPLPFLSLHHYSSIVLLVCQRWERTSTVKASTSNIQDDMSVKPVAGIVTVLTRSVFINELYIYN